MTPPPPPPQPARGYVVRSLDGIGGWWVARLWEDGPLPNGAYYSPDLSDAKVFATAHEAYSRTSRACQVYSLALALAERVEHAPTRETSD